MFTSSLEIPSLVEQAFTRLCRLLTFSQRIPEFFSRSRIFRNSLGEFAANHSFCTGPISHHLGFLRFPLTSSPSACKSACDSTKIGPRPAVHLPRKLPHYPRFRSLFNESRELNRLIETLYGDNENQLFKTDLTDFQTGKLENQKPT